MSCMKSRSFSAFFVLLMVLCSLFLAVCTPVRESLRFQLSDATASLKTSQGREAKQLHEYNTVMVRLPAARLLLSAVQPIAVREENRAEELKKTRNALRKQKKELESGSVNDPDQDQAEGEADEH